MIALLIQGGDLSFQEHLFGFEMDRRHCEVYVWSHDDEYWGVARRTTTAGLRSHPFTWGNRGILRWGGRPRGDRGLS